VPSVIATPSAGDQPWTSKGAEMITALNFIPSTYIEVYADGGAGATKQTVTNVTWQKMTLDVETSDINNLFNNSTYIYTVPTTGVYFCQALIRPVDNQFVSTTTWPTGTGLGIGVHTSEIDGTWFQWNKIQNMAGAGGGRCSLDYTRIASFNASDQLRLYTFSDSGVSINYTTAALVIFRIA
jgi:hypothetical protein